MNTVSVVLPPEDVHPVLETRLDGRHASVGVDSKLAANPEVGGGMH